MTSCVFALYTKKTRRVTTRGIFVGIPQEWHNYFISCHRKYNIQCNQCDICTVHNEKVGWNAAEYMIFQYSDWLYFPWLLKSKLFPSNNKITNSNSLKIL